MRILISGGGTGGHVYPGVTIARAIVDRLPETEVLFVGSKNGLEAEVVPREGFAIETIPLTGIPRSLSPRALLAVWLAGKGVLAARRLIRRFKPDIVAGTGGYVCGPILLAAFLAGVPFVIQEQNAFPGLTNRLMGRAAKRIFLGYAEAARYFPRQRVRETGNPIRPAVTSVQRGEGCARLGLDPSLTTLLVVGASQGARSINEALLTVLPSLLIQPRLQIMHITGKRNYDGVLQAIDHLNLAPQMAARVRIVPYLHNMPDALAAADLVVTRAGALSLAEMTARGLPLILVPFPYATADHQTYNARALERKGAALMIADRDLTGERLLSEVIALLRDENALSRMRRASRNAGRPEAAEAIAGELIRLAERQRTPGTEVTSPDAGT